LPARYKAAKILDERLKQRDEALELYRQALENKNLKDTYREHAQERIDEISKEGELKG
jgi:hypothetical protein